MGGRRGRKGDGRIDVSGGGPMEVSLAEALGLAGAPKNSGKDERPREEPPPGGAAEAGTELTRASRAIVRMERAGRGGRTVTAVELRPPLSPPAAEDAARKLRKSLGCGSRVEDGRIILQGDIRERAAAWLRAAGVKGVTVG